MSVDPDLTMIIARRRERIQHMRDTCEEAPIKCQLRLWRILGLTRVLLCCTLCHREVEMHDEEPQDQ